MQQVPEATVCVSQQVGQRPQAHTAGAHHNQLTLQPEHACAHVLLSPGFACRQVEWLGAHREGPRLVAQLLLQRHNVVAVHMRIAQAHDELASAQVAHLLAT